MRGLCPNLLNAFNCLDTKKKAELTWALFTGLNDGHDSCGYTFLSGSPEPAQQAGTACPKYVPSR